MSGPASERLELAKRRLVNVLRDNVVAAMRTLEQKISDAGPGGMRIDPHALLNARKQLEGEGIITRRIEASTPWFHLATADPRDVAARLSVLRPLHLAVQQTNFAKRLGQTLEIATYRALLSQSALTTFGSYLDLDEHDDSTLYRKEEPPSTISGRTCGSRKLDFIVSAGGAMAGIEIKNVREWMYPNRDEVRDLLFKATVLNVMPVFIARRIPFVTFRLLNACGVIIHQTYNQLFPEADASLAAQVRDKTLLGYHDVRLGNAPDARLLKFAQANLPGLITKLRPRFDEFKDLLTAFGDKSMPYAEFAARVRRRTQGTDEDSDWQDAGDQE